MTHEVEIEEEDGLPVLNAVVESGNESIIQSSRLGREVLRELEMLQQSNPVKFVLQDHILEPDESEALESRESTLQQTSLDASADQESQIDLRIDDSGVLNVATANSEDEIELMIDEVVDRHIVELRKDIRRLLARLKTNT